MRRKTIPINNIDASIAAIVGAAARLVAAHGGRQGLHRLPPLAVPIPLGFQPAQRTRGLFALAAPATRAAVNLTPAISPAPGGPGEVAFPSYPLPRSGGLHPANLSGRYWSRPALAPPAAAEVSGFGMRGGSSQPSARAGLIPVPLLPPEAGADVTFPSYPAYHQDGQPPTQNVLSISAPPGPPTGNIVHLHLGSALDEDTVRNDLIPLLDRLRATG